MQRYAQYLQLDEKLLQTASQMLPGPAQWHPHNKYAAAALLVLWFLHKINLQPELTSLWACGRLLQCDKFQRAVRLAEAQWQAPDAKPGRGHCLTLLDGRQLLLAPHEEPLLDLAERCQVEAGQRIATPQLSSSMWLENCYLAMRAQGL